MSSLLTFTLSNAEAPWSNVFCPHTVIPVPGKEVIGLISASYKSSKLVLFKVTEDISTVESAPLVNPAGAYQGKATESFRPKAPSTATLGGA